MTTNLVLANSPGARYTMGTMMYFAQGIPQGLLGITIPAWLASQGVSAADIASYLAVIVLPWAFKLITGPFMDRFQFRPMGKRRPWVLAAQLGLSLSFLALVLIENPVRLPESMVEGEVRYRLEELVRRLMMQGMDPEKVELAWQQLREQQQEPARKSVHARLVLDTLAREEGLTVESREVEARLRQDA